MNDNNSKLNNFDCRSILSLLGKQFIIPAYQRGYRWEARQVKDLLNDIWEFANKEKETKKQFYCLQPIVVKQQKNNDKYEIIDGQQRLTAIKIILRYLAREHLRRELTEAFSKSEYSLEYETRSGSKQFFEKIAEGSEDSGEYIDYYYMQNTYDTVKEWFKDKDYNAKNKFLKNLLGDECDNPVKIIWYEVNKDEDSIDIFTRINAGKIPLTNAELIKALFLNSSTFKSDDETIRLKQLEIATEWDRIEYALQNDEFWYFIYNANAKKTYDTRIEFIFDLITKIADVSNSNDRHSTFHFFDEKFKEKSREKIDKCWQDIKKHYQILEEWFQDRELYHKVGYLIAAGANIEKLVKDAEGKTKTEFRNYLDSKISDKVQCDNIEELEYGDGTTNNILLLHNIQTILNAKDETSRFPFSRYKAERWSIEHIHARNSKEITKLEDFEELLNSFDNETLSQTSVDRESKIKEAKKNIENIPKIIEEIESKFGDPDTNSIENLALLSHKDNASLGNETFPYKRKKIIELETKGSLIPICTRKVFQKYYQGCSKQMSMWGDADRKAYLQDIKECLKVYQTN